MLCRANILRQRSVRSYGTLQKALQNELESIREAGTYKSERVIVSPQDCEVRVAGVKNPVLNFCANNYLGLADHPQVVGAASKVMESHGFGMSSVRFICGTQDIHLELEKKIAEFHDMDDTILYPSCFDANAGLFEGILTKDDAIISDALNHASIIDGVRLCKAARYRFKHMDMLDLEAKLLESKDARVRLIATDGVFSMDGDVAPLKDICNLAEKHDAVIFIDECHSTGFFGKTGRGTIEHCDVHGRVQIINSTLGKALGGGTGGYTTGKQEIVDILRQRSRPYLFSNSVAPPVVGASLKVFDMLMNPTGKDNYVEKVRANTHLFRDRLANAGFTLSGDYDHPIVPVMLGDARLAAEFAEKMLARDIYVVAFSFPVVPRGEARIRTQMSAAHSTADINFAADAFAEVGKELGLIN
uniref:Aminotransferase class I/classII large domain-containing protein n=1 Tax=Mucochytrium quahogii TaxID=96639 RepID=A0A7S2SEI2_9STRA|mmetsp:Transcript_8897/g.14464  ORF Transcript_8897/g.14464 Transcript_8897/m.14464 type:complete len:416 (+) Transcript_8897:41-1288(+)